MKLPFSIIAISILSFAGCGVEKEKMATIEKSPTQEERIEIVTPKVDSEPARTSEVEPKPAKIEKKEPQEEKDTDGDGWSDMLETLIGSNPLLADTDDDGASDSKDIEPTNPAIAERDDYPTAAKTLQLYLQALKDRDIDQILSFQSGDANSKEHLRKKLEEIIQRDSWVEVFQHRIDQKPIITQDDENWKTYGWTRIVADLRLADNLTLFRTDNGQWLSLGL